MKKEHRGKLFSFETALFFLFKNSWNIKKNIYMEQKVTTSLSSSHSDNQMTTQVIH